MSEAVAITGAGVVSPLGSSVEELTRRVGAGERAGEGPDGGITVPAIPLDAVPEHVRSRIGRADRVCRLALAAACLAVEDAGLRLPGDVAPERVGLSFGTALGCLLSDVEFYEKVVAQGPVGASPRAFAYTVSSAAAGEVSIALGIHGPNATAHMGFAAGSGALGYGLDLIRLGLADVVLAGGMDASGEALVQGLRDMGLLRAASGAGIRPSEGAAILVLEREAHARARGARVRGRLAGWAAGFEPTLTGRDPQRAGITGALAAALADAGVAPADVACVYASCPHPPLAAIERAALADVLGSASPRVVEPKAALGECFGAAGPLAAALALGPGSPAAEGATLVASICYAGPVAALVLR